MYVCKDCMLSFQASEESLPLQGRGEKLREVCSSSLVLVLVLETQPVLKPTEHSTIYKPRNASEFQFHQIRRKTDIYALLL